MQGFMPEQQPPGPTGPTGPGGPGGPGGPAMPNAGPQVPQSNFQQPGMDGKPASPEEQAMYNQFVGHCLIALYDEKFMPRALEMLKGGDSLVKSMSDIGASIMFRVYKAAVEKGVKVPGAVLLQGGIEIANSIAELAEAAGLGPIEPEMVEAAFYLGADTLRTSMTKSGFVNEETLQQQQTELQQMEQSGQLDPVLQHVQSTQQKLESMVQNQAPAEGKKGKGKDAPPEEEAMKGDA